MPAARHLSASPELEPAAVGAQQTAPVDVPQQGNPPATQLLPSATHCDGAEETEGKKDGILDGA